MLLRHLQQLLSTELDKSMSLKYNVIAETFFVHSEGTSEEFKC